MINRDEYVKKLQAKLGEWNAEIDTLVAKAGEVKADAKHEYAEQIEALRASGVEVFVVDGTIGLMAVENWLMCISYHIEHPGACKCEAESKKEEK